jgi:hypothetical protein
VSKAQIDSWISNDGTYSEGLSLYIQHGDNDFLKSLFSKSETVFNRKKLRSELITLSEKLQEQPQTKGKAITDQEYACLPPQGRDLQKQWKQWYARMNALRHKLMDPMTESVRYELALEILSLDEKIRSTWRKIDYWRKYGEFPREVDLETELNDLPLLDLIKRKNNLATYISKFKDNESKSERVLKWRQELLLIEKKIDAAI